MVHSRRTPPTARGKAAGCPPARTRCLLVLIIQLAFCLEAASDSAPARTLSIAHRGDSLFAPENTLAAFSPCLAKADMVEYDVEISSDGALVVIHGPDLDRTTDGTGSVQARTLAELKALDAGSWFAPEFAGERILTLAETINYLAPTTRSLIHAYSGTAEDYVRAIQGLNAKSRVILQSWDQGLIAAAHALDPEIELGVVGQGPLTAGVVTNLQAIGVGVLTWYSPNVDAAAVRTVHSLGAELYVYTVDGPAIQDFLDIGVDGIITDDPALARSLAAADLSTQGQMASEVVSYWQFDDGLSDGSSRTIRDAERRNPGSLECSEPSPCWTPGVEGSFGGALSVDGTNCFVRIPHGDSLDIDTNQLSLSLWVRIGQKPSELSGAYGGVFGSADDSYAIYLDRAAAELRFKVVDRAGQVARPGIPEAFLRTNTWHHLVGVYHGTAGTLAGQALIYLDGRLIDVHTGGDGTGGLRLNAEVRAGLDAAVGRNGAGNGDWLACMVDDLALWRRALTSAEVRQTYAAGLRGLPLQSQTARLWVTQLAPSGDLQEWKLLGSLAHASFAEAGPRVLAAETVEGPYSLLTNVSARLIDWHQCEVAVPARAPGPDRQFFKLVLPTLLLSARFENGTMSGWTVVDEGTIEGPSHWSTESNRLAQTSNIYGPVWGAQTNRQGTFCYWASPSALAWTDYGVAAILNSADDDGIGLLFKYQNQSNYYKLELDRQWGWRRLTKTVNGVETLLAVEAGGYPTNTDLAVSIEAVGDRISAKLDGVLLFGAPVADSSLCAGTVAAYSWGSAGVTFDQVVVWDLAFARAQCPPTLLFADFDGGDRDGWLTVDEGNIEAPSRWTAQGGVLRQDANIYGPVYGAQTNRQGTFCYWADPAALAWTDYTVSAILNTADDDGIGILFRYKNPGNYYKLELDRQWSWRKVTRKVNGVEATLATDTGAYAPNTDLTVSVEASGTSITAKLGGEVLFGGPINDSTLGAGTVAMYSWGSAGVTFDDVLVACPLAPDLKEAVQAVYSGVHPSVPR